MGVFDGYLLCSDCDWTLTDSNRKISRENSEAIRYFQEQGGLFTVATGRYPHYIQEFSHQIVPNTYIISCNGTLLYDLQRDRPVYSIHIEQDIEPLLTFIYREIPSISQVCATSDAEELFRYIRTSDGERELYGGGDGNAPMINREEDIGKLLDQYRERKINRLIMVQEQGETRKNLARLIERFGEQYKFTQSWAEGIEAQNPKSGKGEMILHLKKMAPGVRTTVGVGDNDNDISMLELTDFSFAVANAPDFVKSRAGCVTASCDESALAHVISQLARSIK